MGKIPNSKFQTPNSEFRIPNSKFQMGPSRRLGGWWAGWSPNSKFPIPNSKFPIPILLIALLVALILPFNSFSQGLVPCGNPGQPACQLCHLFVLFENIIDFLIFQIALPLAVLMIAIAGFLYIFAYISPEEALPGGKGGPALLSQAKRILSSVIWGLLIIFSAWLLVGLFLEIIGLNPKWTLPFYQKWWKEGLWEIECSGR